MISRIEGELVSVREGVVEVACGEITYELLVPAVDGEQLAGSIGRTVSFHTKHYLESQGQGAAFVPRLIGFTSADDRAFFEVFTTVKGMGSRKALRALQLPFTAVAAAIAAKDVDLLISLPEIGKRTAETIVAELQGKVDRFIELKPAPGAVEPVPGGRAALIRDAVAVLVQLGEAKLQARQLVDRALTADPEIESADALVAAAFRLKET